MSLNQILILILQVIQLIQSPHKYICSQRSHYFYICSRWSGYYFIILLQLIMLLEDTRLLLNKFQFNQELNIFHSKRNKLNMRKLSTIKEFQSKELLLIIKKSKLKFNIFQNKLKKKFSSTNRSKGLGKEYNIYQLKRKLLIILKEKSMLLVKVANT